MRGGSGDPSLLTRKRSDDRERNGANSISGIGRSGTGILKVDGKAVATQKMERTVPIVLQWNESFDVGADTGTPVDD